MSILERDVLVLVSDRTLLGRFGGGCELSLLSRLLMPYRACR